ncbi:MAG TPA: fimbria/pilus periplasmic chaperone [Stellaceae bacterium]|nr:fimbria/pilus periplasmic chaperone [Stellaceae bacterium]HYC13972.1 fimbria/pilus periplasmic chaperone [Stellaceae bacterium]
MRKHGVWIGLLLAAALATGPAEALRFTPFVVSLAPSGPGANQVFQVENETETSAAIQISLVHRDMGVDGKETLKEAEDDFIVFPPQLVLLPHEARALRLQWAGDPKPAAELPYRIIVEQLPVRIDTGDAKGTQLSLVVRYEGAVYITPEGAKPDIVVERVEHATGPDGKPRLAVDLYNKGTAHAILQNASLTVTPASGGSSITLKADQLGGLADQNVLGGHRRHFLVAWPQGLAVGPLRATLDFIPGL